jgi:serine/threonine protein kinase
VEDFRIVTELARGAHGRVFLAAQNGAADRPVVLKVTPLRGSEDQSLARLQHTHIVPLHSVLDDPAKGGAHSCACRISGAPRWRRCWKRLPGVPHAAGPAGRSRRDRSRRRLVAHRRCQTPARRARCSRASIMRRRPCWIAACLADALHFAHERGVVHLDLKPSNVLLAGDGQPLLLDFHLAREPVSTDGARPDHLGGTAGLHAARATRGDVRHA